MMDFISLDHRQPRIACRYRKCKASFARKTDAHRHETQVHQPTKIFCKFAGCRFRGTVRAEVMRRHLKSKHLFEVESTFQIDNDNLEGGLTKVKIPRESSSLTHKVGSFSSWSTRLLPTSSPQNETYETEHTLDTQMETGYDELRNLNPSGGPKELNMAFPKSDYGIHNRQILGIPRIAENQAIANMASGNSHIPHPSGYSPSQEHLFGWQPGVWASKDCHLDSWTAMIDDSTFS